MLLGKAKGGYGMSRIRRRLQQFIQLPVLILLGIFLILVGVNQSYQAYDRWLVLFDTSPPQPASGSLDIDISELTPIEMLNRQKFGGYIPPKRAPEGLLPISSLGGYKEVPQRWAIMGGHLKGSDRDGYLLAEGIRDDFNAGLILTGGGVIFVLIGIRRTIAEKSAT